MLKTINIPANTETTVTANKKYACAYIENQGTADIYASKNPSVVADADDVTKIQAGETKQLLCESDKVYLLSSKISKAEILFSDYLNLNFRKYLKGGERLKNALKDNLNITADANINSIVTEIENSRYRIKDLSTITNTISCYKITIIDGKVFLLPNSTNAGTIEVRDYQTGVLLKTINDGANVVVAGICFDADYIYIGKTIETITDKKYRDVYVRKYNRCTLEFVAESPILYTGVSGTASTNWSNIFAMVENGEYLYLACVQTMQTVGDFHKIRKIKKVDFSSVADIVWATPLNIIKHENGFFVSGFNTKLSSDTKYLRVEFFDWNLNIIQTLPQTILTIASFRYGFYKDDFLYIGNDKGVLVKYQISTNTIAAEVQISEQSIIYNITLINDAHILLQTNTAKIMLYDLNLNFIKAWDFYNTSDTGGYMINDNNNTIWTQSGSPPTTIYKKQFIDLSSGVV